GPPAPGWLPVARGPRAPGRVAVALDGERGARACDRLRRRPELPRPPARPAPDLRQRGVHRTVHVRVGVDVGGTFTDLVALGPRGLTVVKVPSTPAAPELGIWHACAEAGLTETAPEVLIHGTTIATNALLERKGARVVLVVTAGFEDLLELRRQDRA